eukprot:278973_1
MVMVHTHYTKRHSTRKIYRISHNLIQIHHRSCDVQRTQCDIYTNNGKVFCGGRNGCMETSIVDSDIAYCMGSEACSSANITKTASVVCSGYYSCQFAKIISNGTDLDAHFTAYRSARTVCRNIL